MMRQMRENTKWIMLATALAFVALMVFEWGADVSGRSSGGLGEIGEVNGTPVMYDDYMLVYRNLYDQVQQQQEEPITSQQNKEVEDQAFEELVNQILIGQELDRRGIRVSDAEVRSAAQFSPPPQFAQEPAFQTDGQFDLSKYQTFLATSNEAYLLQLEAYYREVIPRGKLMRQIAAGLHLTDQQLWRAYRDQSETVEIRYIPLDPGARIADADVPVSDAEITEYYNSHQEDFEQPARATVRVAVIGKAPTAADTAASLQKAIDLRAAIISGDREFAEVAQLESTDATTASIGGELGVYPPGAMVPAFDSASFAAPIGQISQPVVTSYGYHLIEVQERWARDSVRARHILIPDARTDSSEVAMLMLADSLEALGEQFALNESASQLGLTVSDAQLTTDFAFVSGAGQVSEGAEWAFEDAEIGDVSPVFETPQGFYAIELVASEPAGVLPIETARGTIEQILLFEKKQARAAAEGAELVRTIRAGEPLPNVASDAGVEVRTAGPFARTDFVPGLGRQNTAIGVSFGLRPGMVSDVVATANNTFIIELLSRVPADSVAWIEQIPTQRTQLESLIQQQRLQQWMAGLREIAVVIDRRAEVLQPLEDQEVPTGYGFGF